MGPDAPFSVENLPSDEAYKASAKAQAASAEPKKKPGQAGAPAATGKQAAAESATQAAVVKAATNAELNKIIESLGVDFGPLQHSCKAKYLTESEAEYTVQVIKHIFKNHLVLELYVSNTVQGFTLENIEAKITGFESQWQKLGDTQIVKLEYNQNSSAYFVLAKTNEEALFGTGMFGAALKFLVKEEGDDLGYDDDYPVENIAMTIGD